MDEGHVVEEFYIGNTHIRICDDYCRDKTPEEVEAILKRIADITLGPLQQVYGTQEEADRAAAEEWINPYDAGDEIRWIKRYQKEEGA